MIFSAINGAFQKSDEMPFAKRIV